MEVFPKAVTNDAWRKDPRYMIIRRPGETDTQLAKRILNTQTDNLSVRAMLVPLEIAEANRYYPNYEITRRYVQEYQAQVKNYMRLCLAIPTGDCSVSGDCLTITMAANAGGRLRQHM